MIYSKFENSINRIYQARKGNRHAVRVKEAFLIGGVVSGGGIAQNVALDRIKEASDSTADGNQTSKSEWQAIMSAFEKGKARPVKEYSFKQQQGSGEKSQVSQVSHRPKCPAVSMGHRKKLFFKLFEICKQNPLDIPKSELVKLFRKIKIDNLLSTSELNAIGLLGDQKRFALLNPSDKLTIAIKAFWTQYCRDLEAEKASNPPKNQVKKQSLLSEMGVCTSMVDNLRKSVTLPENLYIKYQKALNGSENDFYRFLIKMPAGQRRDELIVFGYCNKHIYKRFDEKFELDDNNY